MVKAVVQIARLVTTPVMTIQPVTLARRDNTVTKCFKLRMLLAKHARRAPIRPPKVCPVLADATIVPRANIQRRKATRKRQSAKPVSSDSFKTCPATPRATNAPLDGRLKTAVPNAPLAARARLDKAVKIAQWGLHEQQTTMRANAYDATQVSQPRQTVRPFAAAAI